jgi:hypothetical protein
MTQYVFRAIRKNPMNDKIKELAEQAGDDWDHTLESDKEFLKKFAALVAAEEREACALAVEQAGIEGLGTLAAAAVIRKRGNDV